MLPTFVIGLREGLEAALIVGIIAAFLRKQGRRDLLRGVLAGVSAAVVLCLAAGVALEVYARELPQREQEGLETVIGALAVAMVTYMVVWMRRHSRELKGQLEGMAAQALTGRTGRSGDRPELAIIGMAFLAVIREGLETVVFLLAAFNESGSGAAAGSGAVLGLAVAIALGYGIYRGGVRLNLSRFFRATGLVLVLVAAGLVVNALHTAHEAGWLDIGQGRTVDLSWLVRPGTVQSSLLTGMLGIQPHPVTVELVGWLLYLVPVGLYVAWRPGRPVPARALVRGAAATAVAATVAACALAFSAPAAPAQRPATAGGGMTAKVLARSAADAVLQTAEVRPVRHAVGATRAVRLSSVGVSRHRGVAAEQFRSQWTGSAPEAGAADMTATQVAGLNGGRLPIGIAPTGRISVTFEGVRVLTVWLDLRTDRVLDLRWDESVTATAHDAGRAVPLARPAARATTGLPASASAEAIRAARFSHDQIGRRTLLRGASGWCAGLAGIAASAAAAAFVLGNRQRLRAAPTDVAAVPVSKLG